MLMKVLDCLIILTTFYVVYLLYHLPQLTNQPNINTSLDLNNVNNDVGSLKDSKLSETFCTNDGNFFLFFTFTFTLILSLYLFIIS